MEKWFINCLSCVTNEREFGAASKRASGVRFRALDVRLLLIGQKRKLVKPVNRAKRRDFISNLQGKQRRNNAKLNYFRVYS